MYTKAPANRLTVAVIAGGKSSRMGTDKSFVELLGKPVIAHVLEKMRFLAHNMLIITNRPDDYAHLGLPMYSDVLPEKGSLGGIYTALYYSNTPYTLVAACDMPFVNVALLSYMIGLTEGDFFDVIVPRVEAYPEGLHAIYHQNCREPILKRLTAGQLKVIGFYQDVRVRYLDEPEYHPFDPQALSFFNVNTPDELEEARRRMTI